MKCLLKILLCCMAASASAMTFKEASENLLYFEHASQATAHCEQKGFIVRSQYDGWHRKNVTLYAESIAKIRTESEQRGLTQQEQDQVVTQAFQLNQRMAKDHISKKSIPCGHFPRVLSMYSELLRR
jgi:hypothetical protein